MIPVPNLFQIGFVTWFWQHPAIGNGNVAIEPVGHGPIKEVIESAEISSPVLGTLHKEHHISLAWSSMQLVWSQLYKKKVFLENWLSETIFKTIGLPQDRYSYWESVFPEDPVLYNSSLEALPAPISQCLPYGTQLHQTVEASIWANCTKIGLPGKSILGYYFQENRTSSRPFLLLRISFPGRPISIQFFPELLVIVGDEAVTHGTLLKYCSSHWKIWGLIPKCCEEKNVPECWHCCNQTWNVWSAGVSYLDASFFPVCDSLHFQASWGPSTYDVSKILGFFDPLPPLSAFGTDLQY